MLGNFIYSKSKDLFLQELEAGNVLDEAIVFIEDTKEIWNHGTYFDGKNIDLKITSRGDGSKFLSDDGSYKSISTAYPQANHGTSDTTFALTPNVLHVWDEVTELSLTLADPTDTTVANEYIFQFTSGSTATTLTLPDNIKWLESPSIESDKIYLVSILNNCGAILGFV